VTTTAPTETPWFVYLLLCKSGRIYTGVTPVLDNRLKAHKTGHGALFTKMDPPVRLLAAKPFPSKGAALQIERQVKGVGGAHKKRLAEIWSEQHPVDQATQDRLALA
jgi:putative endonuclease